MRRTREVFILLTLFCYLAASSVASAHGFSVLNQKKIDSVASQHILTAESKGMNCHSAETPYSENSNTTTCEIFCSVLAQAMTEANILISLNIEPLAAIPSFRASVLSRQLDVETHPPK